MIFLHDPKKTSKNFVSKITTDNLKPVQLKIPFSKFMSSQEFEGGKLIHCWIPKESPTIEKIQEIDEIILNSVKKNNTKWFANNLDESKINEFYRPSFNIIRSKMTVLLSKYKHSNIFINNKEIIDEDFDLTTYDFKDKKIVLDIEAQGLYFYPQKFGIRWIIRSLSIYSNEENENDIIYDEKDIENDWNDTIQEFIDTIDTNCNLLENKISNLQLLKKDIQDDYLKALSISKNSLEWMEIFEKISKKISKYYSGSL